MSIANLRQVTTAFQMYVNNNKGKTVGYSTATIMAKDGEPQNGFWMHEMKPFNGDISVIGICPEAYEPSVKGGWGVRGATQVDLKAASAAVLRRAITTAWRNLVEKKPRSSPHPADKPARPRGARAATPKKKRDMRKRG